MRRLMLLLLVCGALAGCQIDELFNTKPPCPTRIAVDTIAWLRLVRNGVAYDSIAVTANERRVCTTTRYTGVP